MITKLNGTYRCIVAKISTDIDRTPNFSDMYPDIPNDMFLGEVEKLVCNVIAKRVNRREDQVEIKRCKIDGKDLFFYGSVQSSPVTWQLYYSRD